MPNAAFYLKSAVICVMDVYNPQYVSYLADKAYVSFTNFKLLAKDKITPTIRLNEMMLYGRQDKLREKFVYHKDIESMECPAGHHSIRTAKMGSKNGNECQRLTFFFDVEKCKECPFQDGCYKPGSDSKKYSVPILSEFKQKAVEYHEAEALLACGYKQS